MKVLDHVRLCYPIGCSLPGASVHGIFQAGVLEWVAIYFSRDSSWPRDQTQVSCIAGRRFTLWTIRETDMIVPQFLNHSSTEEHLSFFQFLLLWKNLWIFAYTFLFGGKFSLNVRYKPKSAIAGLDGKFSFIKNCHTVFQSGCAILSFHYWCLWDSISSLGFGVASPPFFLFR